MTKPAIESPLDIREKTDDQLVEEFRTGMEWCNAMAGDMRRRKIMISLSDAFVQRFGMLSDAELKAAVSLTKIL